MTCKVYPKMIVCNHTAGTYRLPLSNGLRVYMDWHMYLGPIFFRDKMCTREIEEWYNDESICEALDWFQKRGNKA